MNTIYVLLHDKDKSQRPKIYTKKNKEEFTKLNSEGWGVYFSANKFYGHIRTKAECASLRYVFADLDVAKQGDGQTQEEIEKKKEAIILPLITKLHPTNIIDTRNGIQPLWEITDGDVSRIPEYENIIRGIIQWSLQYGSAGDAVQDCARILRLPGYYHQKGEPYLCSLIWPSGKKYTLDEIKKEFYFEPTKPAATRPQNYNPNKISQAIDNIDFQELMIKAFNSVGRLAEFDNTGRLILDGRLTGTFQGRKEDRGYLASGSHEPFKGNRITAVADILQVSNKDARKWIITEYGFNFDELEKREKVSSQLSNIASTEQKPEKQKRYTWGTYRLDHTIVILKRGNLVVLGAKRNMGKTTYTFDMASKNARLGHKVLYISLEMDREDLIEALARNYAGITVDEEYEDLIPEDKLRKKAKKLKEINENTNLNFVSIRRGEAIIWDTIKKIMEDTPSDLVFIDNLDLISSDEREEDIVKQKRIMSNLMSFTSSHNIPVVLIHHYRKGNKKQSQGMDELAGSGKIADSADILINLDRRTVEQNKAENTQFPESHKTVLWVQKGRGYADQSLDIYFVEGTFYDYADIPEDAYHRLRVSSMCQQVEKKDLFPYN